MKFSVIIPAFNEELGIGETIRAVVNQSIARSDYEIIVADNNSKDNTSEAAKKAGADKVVLETTKGTNFARERGAKESQGEILCFLDADSEPPQNWLSHIEADLNTPGVFGVSGPYDHGFSGFIEFMDRLYTVKLLPVLPKILYFLFRRKAGVMIGGNFAVKRSTWEKIGGLPPLAFYGDDAATAMLIARHVGRVWFDPTLRIKSSPRRFKQSGLFSNVFKYMRAYLKVYFNPKYN